MVGSRSHGSPQTAAYLSRLGATRIMTGIGSSLKFCLIAEGNADLYPRFGPTSEWDTAAGQALLEAAGGHVTRPDGHRLRYNCRESLINGDFIAFSQRERAAAPGSDLGVARRLASCKGRVQQRRDIEHHLILGHGQARHAGRAR